jgi:hypothetical protein
MLPAVPELPFSPHAGDVVVSQIWACPVVVIDVDRRRKRARIHVEVEGRGLRLWENYSMLLALPVSRPNSFLLFARDRCAVGRGLWIATAALLAAYESYCSETEQRPISWDARWSQCPAVSSTLASLGSAPGFRWTGAIGHRRKIRVWERIALK